MPLGNIYSLREQATIRAAIAKTIGQQLHFVFDPDLDQPLADDLAERVARLERRDAADRSRHDGSGTEH